MSDDGIVLNVKKLMTGLDSDENLGLSHVWERIEHLQGSFDIQSSRNQGTNVTIKVPLNKENLDKFM